MRSEAMKMQINILLIRTITRANRESEGLLLLDTRAKSFLHHVDVYHLHFISKSDLYPSWHPYDGMGKRSGRQ